MAAQALLKQLARSGAQLSSLAPSAVVSGAAAWRSFAAGADTFSRKDVIYNLDNTSDPEAQAAIKAFQRSAFAAAAKGAATPAPAEPELELTAKIQRKYVAAQIVETGIQSVSVPLDGGAAELKRFAAELVAIGRQAGFDAPASEVASRVSQASAGAESVKELLARLRPFTSPDFHAGLVDALNAVEAESGAAVTLDGGSAGYKKFASKVQALAQAHKLPWQMLLSHKTKLAGASEEQRDALARDFAAWAQSAQLADLKVELEELKAEAARLLDAHLSKSTDAIRKEQEAAAAAVLRRLEVAKGAEWAAKYKQDLEYVKWFDARVAENPAAGPTAATA